jgi:hypothetical protein
LARALAQTAERADSDEDFARDVDRATLSRSMLKLYLPAEGESLE